MAMRWESSWEYCFTWVFITVRSMRITGTFNLLSQSSTRSYEQWVESDLVKFYDTERYSIRTKIWISENLIFERSSSHWSSIFERLVVSTESQAETYLLTSNWYSFKSVSSISWCSALKQLKWASKSTVYVRKITCLIFFSRQRYVYLLIFVCNSSKITCFCFENARWRDLWRCFWEALQRRLREDFEEEFCRVMLSFYYRFRKMMSLALRTSMKNSHISQAKSYFHTYISLNFYYVSTN